RWVDAHTRQLEGVDIQARRQTLLRQLPAADRQAVERLAARCRSIQDLWEAHDYVVFQSNERALRDLQWLYMKLRIARQHVVGTETDADEPKLNADIKGLERDLAAEGLSAATRQSKSATLGLLRRRAQNVARRRQTLDEIDSDLARIEAQV